MFVALGIAGVWGQKTSTASAVGGGYRLSRHYFDLFDLNSFRPDSSSSTSTGDLIIYSFDPPPGATFTMALDASVEAGEHFGVDAVTSVLVHDSAAVQVRYHTRAVP